MGEKICDLRYLDVELYHVLRSAEDAYASVVLAFPKFPVPLSKAENSYERIAYSFHSHFLTNPNELRNTYLALKKDKNYTLVCPLPPDIVKGLLFTPEDSEDEEFEKDGLEEDPNRLFRRLEDIARLQKPLLSEKLDCGNKKQMAAIKMLEFYVRPSSAPKKEPAQQQLFELVYA